MGWSEAGNAAADRSCRANSATLMAIPLVARSRNLRRQTGVALALMKRATKSLRGPRWPPFIPLFALTLALALPAAVAQALTVVNQPWVLPARAGHTTEAFMNLTSTEGATLVAAHSDSAAATTLHRPGRDARAAAELALPAGAIVELAPGKYRFSLRRLSKNVKLGDIVPMMLTIRSVDGVRQDIAVRAVARLRSPVDDERRAHRHQH